MRVLILKISSLGDVVHTLPAITDAAKAIPGIQFDWVIDEAYTEIARWHPAVDRLIVFPHRRWRRQLFSAVFKGEFIRLIRDLRKRRYDLIIDAQGQVGKTMWLAWLAKGERAGMDWSSVREPVVSLAYQKKLAIPKGQHAVDRLRQLFAKSLGYQVPSTPGEYGINREKRFQTKVEPQRLMFLHRTSWITKEWPEDYWKQLLQLATDNGYDVQMTWGNELEQQRAVRLAEGFSNVRILDRLTVTELAHEMAPCAGIVAADTGLGHVAAALAIPTISLYGPTSSGLTGAYGESQKYIQSEFECAPCLQKQCSYNGRSDVQPACFKEISPVRVWDELMAHLKNSVSRRTD
jgi:heptosyltransferase-1